MSAFRQLFFIVGFLFIVAGLFWGTSISRDHYACACGNQKDVVTTTLLFFEVWQDEDIPTAFPFPPRHEHNWFWSKTDKRRLLSLVINGAP